jgi:hypothetical protein
MAVFHSFQKRVYETLQTKNKPQFLVLALLFAGSILTTLLFASSILAFAAGNILDSHIRMLAERATNVVHRLDAALHNITRRIGHNANRLTRRSEEVVKRAVYARDNSSTLGTATCLCHFYINGREYLEYPLE